MTIPAKTAHSIAENLTAKGACSPLKGKKFKFHHIDPATGKRKVMELGG